ncbi:MAG: M24 family metallopeptidase [Acidobacteria bacterium]|nr:MAG: M24 family metallopeptidase [Acidobacteriota bacterium]
MTKRLPVLLLGALLLLAALPAAQGPFTDVFPPEEFAARRAQVLGRIGEGVAILQGSPERAGEQAFRQGNQFFYLTGVEEPRALLVVDGRTKRSTLYLTSRNERRERAIGAMLYPGEEAQRLTGIEAVEPREQFAPVLSSLAREGRTIYTPFRPEVLGSASAGDVVAFAANTASDPWDGRPSREAAFLQKLHTLAPRSEIRNLDPVLDAMRYIKSPREIAVIREATRIGGEAIMAAMREAEPGLHEYELEAASNYVFRKNGAQGQAYFPLFATGKNSLYSHYHKGTAKLAEGDLVQVDYGPDYKYYVSDITRVFPANGRFTPWQREFYGIYLQLYRSVVSSMRPHAPVSDIIADAVRKMDAAMAAFTFTDPKIKDAATRFVERYRTSKATSLGHTIGLEVHDVGAGNGTLQPGQVFTIEPAMTIPEDHMGMRLEDSFVVTETGIENLSSFVPIEIADVEKLMAEPGLRQKRR